jgi:anti-sigma B factor antagonist
LGAVSPEKGKKKSRTMEIQVDAHGKVQVLTCEGRMDAQVSGLLKDRIQELLDKGTTQLVVDMEGLEFLDSSGLGALVSCLRRIKEKKGEIKLAGLRPEVRSIFEITRVSRLFDICETVPDALKAFKKKD